jgi:hypothetical protein
MLWINYMLIQGDKKREFLKFIVAAMYSWQHSGTGTLSYRQARHLVIMDQCKGQQFAVAIFLHVRISSRFPFFLLLIQ